MLPHAVVARDHYDAALPAAMSSREIVVGTCPSCDELWPDCTCGTHTPPAGGVPDNMEPEPPASFVEWVQWKGKHGEPSRYHVRVTSGGWLLCGRKAPSDPPPAANSFPPPDERCSVCVGKLAS